MLASTQDAGVHAVRLITLDPGHFHASLVQKFMYDGVDPLVRVYAPSGDDLAGHLRRIDSFNSRADQPTHWGEEVYQAPDYLERMLARKQGNVVVISGNNARKTDYILRSVDAGLNVLADKPMVIAPADLPRLSRAFAVAKSRGVLLYDIMTERLEITTILQGELSRQRALFGDLVPGTPEDPAIRMESVHFFSKSVAGAALTRPQWFFDVRQQGDAIADVATHLVDLVQVQAFPELALRPRDAVVINAHRWSTPITLAQFRAVTGTERFPDFLRQDVHDDVLHVLSNGEFTYRLRGIHAHVSAEWKFESPSGCGDTHFSVMRGTRATLIIRQGQARQCRPVLYIEVPAGIDSGALSVAAQAAIDSLQRKYPGIGLHRDGDVWAVTVPEVYDVGHEAHFAQVTENFLGYLRAGRLPPWEVPGMLTRYSTVMQADALASSVRSPVPGAWQREGQSIAWHSNGRTLWQFSFDPEQGKPFFNPVSAGATSLTSFRPEDHPWHYGLWFSWKYINGANYWEEDRGSGKAEGATRWDNPRIETRPDGSASIHLDLTYTHPSGRLDLAESRDIEISAADSGGYTIDWRARFTAGPEGALLDRTPMPGEPDGKVNGGYGGLGVRLAASPVVMSVVTPEGPVALFEHDRARPESSAVAANFAADGRNVGAMAILSDAGNVGERAPWYVVNAASGMRFLCAAVLAPQPRRIAPGGQWVLKYRIAIRPAPWSPQDLGSAVAAWKQGVAGQLPAQAQTRGKAK